MTDIAAIDVSRREHSKAMRRDAILGAARSLIREYGAQVSTADIALRAGVSTATVYNLIGPREQLLGLILSALFEDLKATIKAMGEEDPFLVGHAVVVVSAQIFIADAQLWLNVLPEIKGAFGLRVQPFVSFQPINLQRQAMTAAKLRGMLTRAADVDMTATQIYAAYTGALFLWTDGYLSSDGFLDQARAGYWAVLAALASGDHRRRALRELQSLHSTRKGAHHAKLDE